MNILLKCYPKRKRKIHPKLPFYFRRLARNGILQTEVKTHQFFTNMVESASKDAHVVCRILVCLFLVLCVTDTLGADGELGVSFGQRRAIKDGTNTIVATSFA